MQKVSNLFEFRYRVELAVLRRIMRRVLAGEIKAIAICIKGRDDKDEISVMGDYRDDPTSGLGAAMKMSWRLTRLADELEAG